MRTRLDGEKWGNRWKPWTERYWSHVDRRGLEECWLWTGTVVSRRSKNGRNQYGRISCDGVQVLAHRIAYLIHYGPIPDGKMVMHSCDEPRCQNPAHLSAGTQRENIVDSATKGRMGTARGERSGRSKLSEDDVRAIRSMYGVSQEEIAAQYGVRQTTVSRILLRQTWAHVE